MEVLNRSTAPNTPALGCQTILLWGLRGEAGRDVSADLAGVIQQSPPSAINAV